MLSLWAQAGSPPTVTDTRQGLLVLMACDGEALLLAERDAALVGSLIASWDGWRGSFYRLAVHPAHRRHGIATRLLADGERRLRARGAARLTAIVVEDDPIAVGFWRAAAMQGSAIACASSARQPIEAGMRKTAVRSV